MTLDVSDEVLAAWDASTPEKRQRAHYNPAAEDVQRIRRFIGSAAVPLHATWLDWGVGGGALLGVAAQYVPERYLAVDICRQTLDRLDAPGMVKLLAHEVPYIEPASADVLCSFSCFQHFPSREYGLEVLREMRRLAKPGAIGFVQCRYFEPGDPWDPARNTGPYAEQWWRHCAYQIDEFADELRRVGFEPIGNAELDRWRNYAWYRFEVAA